MDLKKYSPSQIRSLVVTASVVLLAAITVTILTLMGGADQTPIDPIETEATGGNETAKLPVLKPPLGGKDETDSPVILPPDTDPAQPTVKPVRFTKPLDQAEAGKGHDLTVMVYSVTMNDYRVHCGVDLYAPIGDDVMAVADGVIKEIKNDPFEGTCVRIAHEDGYESVYKNLAPQIVKGLTVGSEVKSGQTIASVGESMILEIADDSHLHLELYKDGKAIDPLSLIPAV